ncbi:acyl-CoA dehydrogenase family protein [Rhodococcus sp. NPDC059968]|uniref:acyl-CoA dehydrogenase family protein n=1 Tax=Rhodococcus sp. NPDC059968 TaxID=3347017 RepID=UPI00366C50E0
MSFARTIFDERHQDFRETVRRFAERDISPHISRWSQEGQVDRELYQKAGKLGLLGMGIPEEFGGGGTKDFRFNAILIEELARAGASSVVMNLSGFNDLVAPYLEGLGTAEQKNRWLEPMVSGRMIGAIALTEPSAGSDLGAITTVAHSDGDDFIVNGRKIFISNGILADTVIVAVVTDPQAGKKGISLLLIDADSPGFFKTGPLKKVGLLAQDTAELFFEDVRVPKENLLGDLNSGFQYLRRNLPQERLSIAVSSMGTMQRTFEKARTYAIDRTAFGQRLIDMQANRFYLAEIATEIEIAQVFIDRCILDASAQTLDETDAAMAKWWITELHLRVVHRAVQLHGGYGYMKEYDVAQDFLDSRIGTIYGGANEIMKEIIGRKLAKL